MKFTAKKAKKLTVKLVLLALIIYIIFIFINQCVKIKTKKEELQSLNEQILVEKNKNREIENMLEENNQAKNSDNSGETSRVRVFENIVE